MKRGGERGEDEHGDRAHVVLCVMPSRRVARVEQLRRSKIFEPLPPLDPGEISSLLLRLLLLALVKLD